MLEKLKQKRISKDLSYQDMANKLNISKTFYWQLENEKRNLSYKMSVRIANILKTKPDQLFYDEISKQL